MKTGKYFWVFLLCLFVLVFVLGVLFFLVSLEIGLYLEFCIINQNEVSEGTDTSSPKFIYSFSTDLLNAQHQNLCIKWKEEPVELTELTELMSLVGAVTTRCH